MKLRHDTFFHFIFFFRIYLLTGYFYQNISQVLFLIIFCSRERNLWTNYNIETHFTFCVFGLLFIYEQKNMISLFVFVIFDHLHKLRYTNSVFLCTTEPLFLRAEISHSLISLLLAWIIRFKHKESSMQEGEFHTNLCREVDIFRNRISNYHFPWCIFKLVINLNWIRSSLNISVFLHILLRFFFLLLCSNSFRLGFYSL